MRRYVDKTDRVSGARADRLRKRSLAQTATTAAVRGAAWSGAALLGPDTPDPWLPRQRDGRDGPTLR